MFLIGRLRESLCLHKMWRNLSKTLSSIEPYARQVLALEIPQKSAHPHVYCNRRLDFPDYHQEFFSCRLDPRKLSSIWLPSFLGYPTILGVPFWLIVYCSLTPLLVKIANISLDANQTFHDESEQRRPEQTHTLLVTLPSPPQFLFWASRTLGLTPVNSVRSSFWRRQPVLVHHLSLTSFLSIFLPCPILVSVAMEQLSCVVFITLSSRLPFGLSPSLPQVMTQHQNFLCCLTTRIPSVSQVSTKGVFQESPPWQEDSTPCHRKRVKNSRTNRSQLIENYSNKLKISTFKLHSVLQFFSFGEKWRRRLILKVYQKISLV